MDFILGWIIFLVYFFKVCELFLFFLDMISWFIVCVFIFSFKIVGLVVLFGRLVCNVLILDLILFIILFKLVLNLNWVIIIEIFFCEFDIVDFIFEMVDKFLLIFWLICLLMFWGLVFV